MSSKDKPIIEFNAIIIAYAHLICASAAFSVALIVGCYLHYYKIVQNGFFGYPDEWFPSVSATIGDRYPERSIFQILIALTAGPRFLLLFICYLRLYKRGSKLNNVGLVTGFVRTVTCGGWVYITSTDDHDFHDIFMISYIVLTIPWTVCITLLTEKGSSLRRYRRNTSLTFFAALVPLVYLFIQHKVHRVPGAYSYYAYVEWSLILLDIGFDAWTIVDFQDIVIKLSATNGSIYFQTVNDTPKSEKVVPQINKELEFGWFQTLVNIINAFIFWSIVTSLPLCVWHFPLWNMGISGYEAVIVTFLSPIILTVPFVKTAFSKFSVVPRLVAVVFAIGLYRIDEPSSRLLSIAVGNFLIVSCLASDISNLSNSSIDKNLSVRFYSITFTIGLLLSSLAKFMFWTNNPIWPIMHSENGGYNVTGIVIGIFGALFLKSRFNTLTKPKLNNSLLLAGVGLGGLVFSLSAMLTDSTTIILWCWDGYPVTGPLPVPHGALTLIAMAVGVYLGFTKLTQLANWKFFTFGAVGATMLYLFNGWLGYAGGLIYTVFVIVMVPIVFTSVAQFQPGLVFFIGFLIHMIFILAHVWVVAYAFVPGGWILRERSDIVLGTSVLCLAAGLRSYRQIPQSETTNTDGERWEVKFQAVTEKTFKILTLLIALSCFISFKRFNIGEPTPYHPESKLITAGIWTIHFGLDNDMWASEYRMRDLIRDAELDIVGLLESDTQRMIMGNRDLTQHLAEDLGMYADYGPGPNKHTWGCALLSKFPIINSTHHLLPSPVGELAPAIHATLDIYGELVDVVVFHSGQEEDVEDRRLQSLKLAEIMGSSNRPMILLSYLVITPLEGNYNTYVSEQSGMHDIDPSDWDRWCEYILFKNLKRVGYARISRSTITDTELQVGKFTLRDKNVDVSELYTNNKIDEEDVVEDMRFPSKFYGDGVRDHRFHVFDEPRYFE